jgi:succinyl-CoA synthetase beta subunit
LKLHEYQAKELLARLGVPVPRGQMTTSPGEAARIASGFNGKAVVKAQVHMGGRGKAGGIRLTTTPEEAEEFTRDLIGTRLVSPQNPAGMVVEKVLVAEQIDVEREYYVAITLDRAERKDVVMLSAIGGVEIEQVAAKHPDSIVKLHVDPAWGLDDFRIRAAVVRAGIDPRAQTQMAAMIRAMLRAYRAVDASLVEVNPCALTPDGKLYAADAKVSIDDNALFRQREYAELAEASEPDPIEREAYRRGIAYVRLGGDVGVVGNGAGLVMCTLDEVARAGGKAANFLDIGGGAQADAVTGSVELVLMDPNVRGLLINIFGGITRCDEVAKGLLSAFETMEIKVPVVLRLEGTKAEEGRALLQGTRITPATTMQEAAETIVSLIS